MPTSHPLSTIKKFASIVLAKSANSDLVFQHIERKFITVYPCTHSLSVSIVFWFHPRKVRSKCECMHSMHVCMALLDRPNVHYQRVM